MISRTKLTILAGAILLAGSAGSARADYNFTFETIGSNTLTTSPNDQSTQLPGTYGNIAIYMDKVIGGQCATLLNCVTVQGLDANGNTGLGAGFGVAVAQKYTGEGFVVGPNGVPLTLGNSTGATSNASSFNPGGAYDNYLSNTATQTDGSSANRLSNGILITFSQGIKLNGTFSFDLQIFPDGTCPSLPCGTSTPDLTFTSNGTATTYNWVGVTPSLLSPDGNSTKSPNHAVEVAPQWIGTSGSINLTNATTLKFMDWPETIGIDNLKLVTATPEPMGQVFLLAGLGLVALAGKWLRRTLAKSTPEA